MSGVHAVVAVVDGNTTIYVGGANARRAYRAQVQLPGYDGLFPVEGVMVIQGQ